jgi:hypothetical protein
MLSSMLNGECGSRSTRCEPSHTGVVDVDVDVLVLEQPVAPEQAHWHDVLRTFLLLRRTEMARLDVPDAEQIDGQMAAAPSPKLFDSRAAETMVGAAARPT